MATTSNGKKMKAVVFAGGIGTRMWPLSRKTSPKQFEKIIGDKSTLQLTVDRLRPEYEWEDIYISTGEQYRRLVIEQLPQIPEENVIGEPEMRDVAPAVGYLMAILALDDPDAPVSIHWSDHQVQDVPNFKKAIFAGGNYLSEKPNSIVFIGHKPRFANQNLGWIEYGEQIDSVDGIAINEYKSWHYRPEIATAKKYFKSGHHAWNPGYFTTTPGFIMDKYKAHSPELYAKIMKIMEAHGTDSAHQVLQEVYPTMEKVDFDTAVVRHIPNEQAVVLSVDFGWSDVGTWESLKEAVQEHPNENITNGKVHLHKTGNSVVYSYTDQLITTIDMENVVVVATDDVIMVTRQQAIPEIKKMLKEFAGTDLESYT